MSIGTVWPLEPHTAAKHQILRRYLGAWFSILGRYSPRLVYVDGFCGPGRYSGGEPGSPVVALDVIRGLSERIAAKPEFVFIDNDLPRIQNLRLELQDQKWSRYTPHIDCEEFRFKFPELLDLLVEPHRPTPPLFTFIDPFGFSGIPFDLVQRILSYDRSEAFILLNTDALQRFLGHPNQQIRSHIRETFGTSGVFEILASSNSRLSELRELYQKQLLGCARFVRYFEMLDSNGATIYHLFFATNNSRGFEKMKEAMWAVDQTGAFRFSDKTDPNQMILMGPDSGAELAATVTGQFGGRTVDAQEVKRWVIESTIYLSRHATGALRYAEVKGLITVDSKKRDGRQRRKNSFPDGSMIQFPGR